MELGWSYPKRRELIDRMTNATSSIQNKHPINFQGARQFFPIFTVEISMPKYRLSNGRTQDAQQQYYTKESLPADFFENDIELEEVHVVQHNILKKQLQSGKINLLNYFFNRVQEEPLILDNNGYVVNGNRRLCAMREINHNDVKAGNKPAKFSHIEVIILPPCSEDDILTLEGKLQITEDIQADYVWTAEGCMYRTLRDKKGYNMEKIAGIYEKKKEDIEELLLLLTYVDQYLESRKIPKQYEVVLKDKFAFEAIVKGRKKLGNDDDKKDIFQSISFSLIENGPLPNMGRLHSFIPKVVDNIDEIIQKALKEFPSDPDLNTVSVKYDHNDDIDLLGNDDFEGQLIILAQNLDKECNRENIVHFVKDIIESEDDRQLRFSVIQKLQRANALLQDAVNMFDEKTEIDGIESQIDSIKAHIKAIKEKL